MSKYEGAYHNIPDTIYAVLHGTNETIAIDKLQYRIERERVPIYSMGSSAPASFSRGKIGIFGTIYINADDLGTIDGKMFDIYVLMKDRATKMHFKDVSILSTQEDKDGCCLVSFLSAMIGQEKVVLVQETTNREMARKVLSMEY